MSKNMKAGEAVERGPTQQWQSCEIREDWERGFSSSIGAPLKSLQNVNITYWAQAPNEWTLLASLDFSPPWKVVPSFGTIPAISVTAVCKKLETMASSLWYFLLHAVEN